MPEVTNPECVSLHCGCDAPGVMRDCDFDCAALCGGGGGDSGGGTTANQGTPPIFKLVGAVVVGTVVAGMFAVAPGHTFDLFSKKPQDARAAREAWDEHREALASLEREGAALEREARALEGALREARRPPVVALAGSYAPVPPRQPPAPWAAGGPCSDLVVANEELLRKADREATEQSLSFLPRPPDPVAEAKKSARAALVTHAGPRRLAAQRKELLARYDAMKAWNEWLSALVACTDLPDNVFTGCVDRLLATEPPAALKEWLEALVGDGVVAAEERVREAASFLTRHTRDLEAAFEVQALGATRCR